MIPPQQAIESAVEAAKQSPCLSPRGVALWAADGYGFGCSGFNDKTPSGERCTRDAACKATCGKLAAHAEARCLLFAGPRSRGASMLHIKVLAGKVIPSGPPSCLPCAVLMDAAEVSWFWLFHFDGWQRYSMSDFYLRTLETVASLEAEREAKSRACT